MGQTIDQVKKFNKVERSIGKMLFYNFIGGIAWGLGVLIGTTIIFAIVAYFASNIDFVPIFGKFMANVIESAQTNLQAQ